MDLKFGFCVLSLNLLILLVAYGTEARKMVEWNMQDKRLNIPVAQVRISSYEDLQNKDDTQNFWIFNNQGYNNHQQAKIENAQVRISSYGDLQTKDDIQKFGISNNQGDNNHQQTNTENAQVRISSYGDLQNKDDTQNFWIYNNQRDNNHQQAKTENAQVRISSYENLQNKDDIQNLWIFNNHGDNNHQQAKIVNAQVRISSYGDLQNKDDTQNQGDNNHQQAKTENAQVRISSYGDLQNKNDTQNFEIYNNQGDNNHQQAKIENAQIGISSYGNLQNKDETKNFGIYNNQGENNHQEEKEENVHIHSSSHMDHIDPSLRVFFLMDDLKIRKEISVSFPRRDLSSNSPSFLPKEEADSIPFSLKELPNLLQRFSISRNSPHAKAMEDTLRVCEALPIKGETKYCATSTKAMLDFVQEILGEETQIKALSTIHFSNSTPLLQMYTILDVPQEVAAPKMVACHTMPYAYAVFYCHYNTISKSKVFKVSLGGENGDIVEAIAVCHLDTSEWSPSHVSFQVLGILPGTSPICHFFPSDNLVWVQKITTAQVI